MITFGHLRVRAYCFCSSAESSDIRWPSAVILWGNFNIGWCDLSWWSNSPSGLLFCALDSSLDWLSFLDSLLGSVLAGSSCLVSSDEDWELPESDAKLLNYAHYIREQTWNSWHCVLKLQKENLWTKTTVYWFRSTMSKCTRTASIVIMTDKRSPDSVKDRSCIGMSDCPRFLCKTSLKLIIFPLFMYGKFLTDSQKYDMFAILKLAYLAVQAENVKWYLHNQQAELGSGIWWCGFKSSTMTARTIYQLGFSCSQDRAMQNDAQRDIFQPYMSCALEVQKNRVETKVANLLLDLRQWQLLLDQLWLYHQHSPDTKTKSRLSVIDPWHNNMNTTL